MARHVLLNALFQQGLNGLKFFQIWKRPQLAQTSGGCAVNAMKNGHGKTLAVQKHHQHGLQRAIGLRQHRLLAAQGKLGIKAVFLGNALVDFAARLHRIGEVLRQQVLAIGLLHGRLHVLCFTETADGIRIISFRKANEREVKRHARSHTAD